LIPFHSRQPFCHILSKNVKMRQKEKKTMKAMKMMKRKKKNQDLRLWKRILRL